MKNTRTTAEQTGGPKEEGQEKNPLLPVLQEKRQPRQQERLLLQEFETGVHDEQAEEEVQHLPDWFQQPTRLPSPDHAWNKSVPAVHDSVPTLLSIRHQRQDPQSQSITNRHYKSLLYFIQSEKTGLLLHQTSIARGFLYETKTEEQIDAQLTNYTSSAMYNSIDVLTAQNDRLKGNRMSICLILMSHVTKQMPRARFRSIDKRLKTRRIMRSLERFVGGRPYGGSDEIPKRPTIVLQYMKLKGRRLSLQNPMRPDRTGGIYPGDIHSRCRSP
ncbi:hypothetical protein Tco_0045043 [Tanacetum coccineum]